MTALHACILFTLLIVSHCVLILEVIALRKQTV
jgi:hypothetical protein